MYARCVISTLSSNYFLGLQIFEQCIVDEVVVDKGQKVIGVNTSQGQFETGCYVDATGIVRSF